MVTIVLIFALILLAAPVILLGWAFWKAEEEAQAKVFDSSIDHTKQPREEKGHQSPRGPVDPGPEKG